jgi:hypothetical protein
MSQTPDPSHYAGVFVRSRLHLPLLAMRSSLERGAVFRARGTPPPHTAFCASPYKTGTTYIAGRFAGRNRVAHEPLHYTTIRHLSDTTFFSRRLAHLGLAFECSGFLANHLATIRACLPAARVIYLVRSFSDWLPSVVTYFSKLRGQVRYNYVCRLLFDRITVHPLDRFLSLTGDHQRTVVESLLTWWLSAYEEAMADPLCLLMPLDALDDRITEVEDFLHLRADRSVRPWKRAAAEKYLLTPSDFLDLQPYAARIEAVETAMPLGGRSLLGSARRQMINEREAA